MWNEEWGMHEEWEMKNEEWRGKMKNVEWKLSNEKWKKWKMRNE